jgi:hypothetical protein
VSETRHSPEPWRSVASPWNESLSGDQDIFDTHGLDAAMTVSTGFDGKGNDLAAANARRIVACVNALAGIPTEALEAGALRALIEAAQGIFPWGPVHALPLVRAEAVEKMHAALRALGRLP